MNAVSDESPDVDSAGVYFVSVEEFEQREPRDNEPERPSGERPIRADQKSATRADPETENPPPLSESSAATPRELLPIEAHVEQ